MGWTETCAVDERLRLVVAVREREESFAALCRRFGVSRRVGYKWLARFEEEGAAGLFDRSRAPLDRPQRLADDRRLAPPRGSAYGPDLGTAQGPRLSRAEVELETEWPAASTIGELFDREGLTVKRKLRRRSPPSSAPFADCEAANDVWCIDFKGDFLPATDACYPLTVTDADSRFLIAVRR